MTAIDDAIRQARLDRLVRTYAPGDTVPYSWCTNHRRITDEGDDHCGESATEGRCHMVALVTGDPL